MSQPPLSIPDADEHTVLEANIAFHTALAADYDDEQPHFRAENKALVSARLSQLANTAGGDVLVDFGCGTGFVIQLALPYFRRVYGVDATPAMLQLVDVSSGRVELLQARTDQTGLPDATANVITANSFLHHLYDIRPTLQEAYRVLKPGGVFFSEEDPNHDFWHAIAEVRAAGSQPVAREVQAVLNVAEQLEEQKGISATTVRLAEYQKMVVGGMRADHLRETFKEIGFSDVHVEYYWFLGEASVRHGESAEAASRVEAYLRSVLPLSSHLFKYLRIEARK
jgi:ubiquinone/menaquinone biosynthesis C-methylase UbiE